MFGDSRDESVFQLLLECLNSLGLAYVHTGNYEDQRTFAMLSGKTMTGFMRSHYQGALIACGGYTADQAQAHIDDNDFDLVAMGRPFIANPDLIYKLKNKESLVAYDNQMLGVLY
jgi:2,4-dienoyl-CoA reductase-like NADH-dependent reductase (Old Yellow Enzyme family)